MAVDLSGYMGRGILSGLTSKGEPADVYFAEGRSPPSRMRKLEPCPKHGIVHMDINSETDLEKLRADGGDPALLLYDAMRGDPEGLLVVSNGYQTDHDADMSGGTFHGLIKEKGIFQRVRRDRFPLGEAVEWTLAQTGSEPDPLRTARIAVARDYVKTPDRTNIGVVIHPRDIDGKIVMDDKREKYLAKDITVGYRNVPLKNGEFIIFATYGVHTPSFENPQPPEVSTLGRLARRVYLDGTNPEQLADEVFGLLPEIVRVGVAAAMRDDSQPMGFRFAKRNVKE